MLGKVRRPEMGVSLAEVLVALFIMSVVGVAAVVGLGTTVKVNDMARTRITAESLARAELEYISSQPFPEHGLNYRLPDSPTYPVEWVTVRAMPEGYTGTGYSILVQSSVLGSFSDVESTPYIKQKITAIVYYGDDNKEVLKIETYRTQY